MGTVGSSVNALANEYLKELATVDEPVETVSVLWLRCYMKEGANSSGAKVEGLGLEFRRSRVSLMRGVISAKPSRQVDVTVTDHITEWTVPPTEIS